LRCGPLDWRPGRSARGWFGAGLRWSAALLAARCDQRTCRLAPAAGCASGFLVPHPSQRFAQSSASRLRFPNGMCTTGSRSSGARERPGVRRAAPPCSPHSERQPLILEAAVESGSPAPTEKEGFPEGSLLMPSGFRSTGRIFHAKRAADHRSRAWCNHSHPRCNRSRARCNRSRASDNASCHAVMAQLHTTMTARAAVHTS
jgi:hypothetical protein